MLNDVMSKPRLLNPYLYTFSLYENPSFIIVSAETECFDKVLVSEYKLFKRSNKTNLFYSPGPVTCFSDKDDVSRNQNTCYWPLQYESIARCKQHMQEKLVYCCTYLENL